MFEHALSRRRFLQLSGTTLATTLLPGIAPRAEATRRLSPAAAEVHLVGNPYPVTPVWAYDGQVPGPLLRYRQGDTLKVTLDNRLAEATTVHWHGLRLPNGMDGVPHLTQPPTAPGETFDYEFTLPDAGTFWYHPHVNSSEQVGRGLHGALIVEEPEPPAVDRELLWVLDDWRLTREGAVSEDFGNFHDFTHAGRIGNTVTLNGRLPDTVAVHPGERLRLRLINVANARIFSLNFEGHRPRVIALDGQPVTPFAPDNERVVLGPAMRADLILDCTGEPGARHRVVDDAYPRQAYRLLDLVYDSTRLRAAPLSDPVVLPANPLPAPDLGDASRHEFVFTGGAMGGMPGAMMGGHHRGMRELVGQGKAWAINGVVPEDYSREPLLRLDRGESTIFTLDNRTAFEHPMHLHGYHFRVLSRDGRPAPRPVWRDTVLVAPRERVEIAFRADNPGDWMFHCHTLEHQMAGLMGFIRVA